jgi:dienelactone hydrolase
LAPLIGVHDLVGVSDRGEPIEALAERVAHEGARCHVVATYARGDISNMFTTVGDGDAPLQDAGRGTLV